VGQLLVRAGGGDDLLESAGGSGYGQQLQGESGDDRFVSRGAPSGGFIFLDGGTGTDFALIDRSTSTRSLTLDLGASSLRTSLGEGTALVNIERIAFTAGSGNDALTGGALADTLSGGAGRDGLDGGAGDDRLFGGEGRDYLDGGIGIDVMQGGAGDDTYVVDGGRDAVFEAAGEGTDTVLAFASATLDDGVEIARAMQAGLTVAGNGLANRLFDHAGGTAMAGGAGSDIYYVRGSASNLRSSASVTAAARGRQGMDVAWQFPIWASPGQRGLSEQRRHT
jgi:Ca2+-binding RTX toxin-like protein